VLSKLAQIRVEIREIDLQGSSFRLYLLSCKLPEFPFGDRKYVWYPLLLRENQTEIDRHEVEAILRHLWHASTPFFDDELEQELRPDGDREQVIADAIDAKARSIASGNDSWQEPGVTERLRNEIGFEMSQSELAYFECYVLWRRETPIVNASEPAAQAPG
jgi:hypothetical protein